MSTLQVTIEEVTILPHPNADKLEIAQIKGYQCVVGKGQVQTGDVIVYIPEQSIVPEWIIKRLGLEGRLAGSNKNRVKAVKLRQSLSQGIVYPVNKGITSLTICMEDPSELVEVFMGQNVAEIMGITKYEVPIPTCLSGEVCNVDGYTLKYDLENIKWYPDIIHEGEQVVISEKIHGSNFQIGYVPELNNPELINNNVIVISKGLGAKGLSFKDNEANSGNAYMCAYKRNVVDGKQLHERIAELPNKFDWIDPKEPMYLVGELVGQGIQDLTYGITTPEILFFDVYIGKPGQGRYAYDFESMQILSTLKVKTVPELFRGAFSKEVLERCTNGTEMVSEMKLHIREGCVVRPALERYHPEIGRVILKSVSEAYLLRGGDVTEYN